MNPLIAFLLARLREPSTYAGLGTIAAAVGLSLSAAQLSAVTGLLIALAGAAAVFIPETKTVATVAKVLLIGVLAAGISACSSVTLSADTQKFASDVAAFDANYGAKIKAFSAGAITDVKSVGQAACGYISMADGLYNAVKPVALVVGAAGVVGTPEAVAIEAGTMVAVNLACAVLDKADPNAPVATIATAAATAIQAVPQVKAALAGANPAVAAAASASAS